MTDPTAAAPTPKQQPKNKGGRPRNDVTKTPEFKAAVDAAQSAIETRILAAVSKLKDGTASAADVPESDRELIQRMALTFAEIADQGSGRKRVAPEVLAKRAEANARMIDILVRGQARGWPTAPEYRVISKTYLNEQVVEPYRTNPVTKQAEPIAIEWTGIPNECMEPLNDVAREIFTEFMASIGGYTPLTANADRRPVIVTSGGLVIKGTGHVRRQVGTLEGQGGGIAEPAAPSGFSDRLGVLGPNDPRAKSVRVLGTVAPAARQNVA